MLSDRLLECLICPVCHGRPLVLVVDESDGDLIVQADLACPGCKRRYAVREEIPVMMPPELGSNLSASNERWDAWGTAMHRFLRWRDAAWADPDQAATRRERAREMHERFLEFCDLQAGPADALDVGCGTGHVVDLLPEEVRYIGIDPLPGGHSPGGAIPAEMPKPVRTVSLVQGVGEHLPFSDDSFDLVLMMGTLDHTRSAEEALDEAARVLHPEGMLCVLLGLGSSGEEGGIGYALRSLVQSLRGQQGPGARETHMRTFSSMDEVCSLLSSHFRIHDAMEHSNRAFVRAGLPGGGT
ncbi:MAG: methyltransferase domain-containing protein [Armatimonadota bacterium]